MRVALLAWLLGGCHVLFRLDEVPLQSDASVDATYVCDTYFDHLFPGPDPCVPWGHPDIFNAAMVEEHDGLIITPTNQFGSRGACYGDALVPLAGGIVVEVPEVIDGNGGEFTMVGLNPINRAIAVSTGNIMYQVNDGTQRFGMLLYVPDAMRWWRLRPNSARTELIAEYSADAQSWSPLGPPVNTSIPQSVYVALLAGYNSSQNTGSGRAVFRRLIVCR